MLVNRKVARFVYFVYFCLPGTKRGKNLTNCVPWFEKQKEVDSCGLQNAAVKS